MAVDSTNPLYDEVVEDYVVMRTVNAGERKVKIAGTVFLPPTAGMVEDGALTDLASLGYAKYVAYRKRAKFPEYVRESIETFVGVMVREPAVIELPDRMEPLRDSLSKKGESAQQLLRRIFEQQLLFGRIGLLVDAPQFIRPERGELPHLVEYCAESIINWDEQPVSDFQKEELSLVVVDETKEVRSLSEDPFEFEPERQFRVFTLEPVDPELPVSESNPLVYKTWVETDDVRLPTIVPMFFGNTFDFIPFTIIGSNDMNWIPDDIPMLPLANQALYVYRKSADHEQALHFQGQDTLVIVGQEINADGTQREGETRVGAGAKIQLAPGEGTSADFIGVDSEGLGEMRTSRTDAETIALEMGARLLEPRKGQAESGEALKIRVAASTANLHQVALTGAAGLEAALRNIAVWMGEDPSLVRVIPNLDFTEDSEEPRNLGDMMDAKAKGAPISLASTHRWAADRNLTHLTFEQEIEQIRIENTELADLQPEPEETAASEEEEQDEAEGAE